MSHFCATCHSFAGFSFISVELRNHRSDQGDRFPNGNVKFSHGVLDTRIQGYTEAEAAIINRALRGRTDSPLYGRDIRITGGEELPRQPQLDPAPAAAPAPPPPISLDVSALKSEIKTETVAAVKEMLAPLFPKAEKARTAPKLDLPPQKRGPGGQFIKRVKTHAASAA
jgi:hypothetical protein